MGYDKMSVVSEQIERICKRHPTDFDDLDIQHCINDMLKAHRIHERWARSYQATPAAKEKQVVQVKATGDENWYLDWCANYERVIQHLEDYRKLREEVKRLMHGEVTAI